MTFVADFHQDASLLHVLPCAPRPRGGGDRARRAADLRRGARRRSASWSTAWRLRNRRGVRREGSRVPPHDRARLAQPGARLAAGELRERTSRARLRRGITQADAIEQTKAHHRAIYDALRHHRPDLAGRDGVAHIASVETWFEQYRSMNQRRSSWARNVRRMDELRALRDRLLEHREDWAAACASFAWPVLDEFNWALDWFDPLRARQRADGLLVVEADGSEAAAVVRRRSPGARTSSRTGCARRASRAATGSS